MFSFMVLSDAFLARDVQEAKEIAISRYFSRLDTIILHQLDPETQKPSWSWRWVMGDGWRELTDTPAYLQVRNYL
ncbi:MAG: hypothetical protein Q7S32_04730 [bacterium]|nr:hypothetical protein [bacterium]